MKLFVGILVAISGASAYRGNGKCSTFESCKGNLILTAVNKFSVVFIKQIIKIKNKTNYLKKFRDI